MEPLVNPNAATLRLALLPRAGLLADVLLVGVGAALVSVAAQVAIPLPFTPVPVTGQTFAVLLVGASLGSVRASSSLGLYLTAGILGAPVYADGTHGWAIATGPTGGYLLGFLLAAALTGALAERRWDRRLPSALAAMLAGNIVIYLCGLAWLAASLDTSLEKTLELGLYPFIAGDLVKLCLAGALLPGAWQTVPALTQHDQQHPGPETRRD